MSQLDVIDEALIRAEPAAVFDAIVALMAGETSWWAPHLHVNLVGEKTPDLVGRQAEISIPGRARFVARVDEATSPTHMRVSYISGDFRGEGLWTYETASGGTLIRLHWQADPTRWWMRFLTSAITRNHSRVMQLGFRALDEHLSQARAA